jgi:hypothetical protein
MKHQIILNTTFLIAAALMLPLVAFSETHRTYSSGAESDGDGKSFDWLIRTDGTQYKWVDSTYAWGKGYFMQRTGSGAGRQQVPTTAELHQWNRPIINTPALTVWREGRIEIRCQRQISDSSCTEQYTFTNMSNEWVYLEDVGIYTPFNDNYPDSKTCLSDRCHTHI